MDIKSVDNLWISGGYEVKDYLGIRELSRRERVQRLKEKERRVRHLSRGIEQRMCHYENGLKSCGGVVGKKAWAAGERYCVDHVGGMTNGERRRQRIAEAGDFAGGSKELHETA